MSVPGWVRREPTIWVTEATGADPRIPTGACVVSLEAAAAVVGGAALPSELGFAWFQGARVRWAADAHPCVAQMGARLAERLASLTADEIAQLAQDRALIKTAEALRASRASAPVSRTALAAQATEQSPDGTPLLGREARLLLALEYL